MSLEIYADFSNEDLKIILRDRRIGDTALREGQDEQIKRVLDARLAQERAQTQQAEARRQSQIERELMRAERDALRALRESADQG